MAKPSLRRFRLGSLGSRQHRGGLAAREADRAAVFERLEPRVLLSAVALDPTFGEGGITTLDLGQAASGIQTLVLPDGKLLVAGDIGEGFSRDLVLARFNASGTLDTTFGGGDGWLSINLLNSDAMGGLALDSLGRIVIAATAGVGFNSGRAHVLRLMPDGQFDTTFNGSGKVAMISSTAAHAVQIDSQDRIVIAGERFLNLPTGLTSTYMLARWLPNGAIDPTFQPQGPGSIAGPAPFTDFELLPDASILAVGYERWAQTNVNFSVRYFRADGSAIFTGFGETGAGLTIVDFAGLSDLAFAMSRDSAGRILAAGYATAADGMRQIGVARLAADGGIDRTFGVDGRVMIPVGASAEAHDIIPMPDGSILVVGQTTSLSGETDSVIVRLFSEGQLDLAFDGDGVMVIDFGGSDGLRAAVLDDELNLLVTGDATSPPTHSDLLLARFQTTAPDVNEAPVGNGEAYGVSHDRVLTVAAPGVLGNDADAEGDALTAALESGPPTHGAFVFNADGSFTYTPTAGFVGSDSFTYRAFDGELQSNLVTVTLNVTNAAPTVQFSSFTTLEDVPIEGAVTGSDADGDALTFSVVGQPANGSLAFNPDGTFVYTPNPKYHGNDVFSFKASDGLADSKPQSVRFSVVSVNEAPVAVPDSYIVPQGKEILVEVPGVVANDHDPDGDSLVASLVRPAAHGSVTLLALGSFRYRPETGFTGFDSFDYRIHDGTEFSNTVTVTFEVVNTPPVVEDAAFSVNEDTYAWFTMPAYSDAENNIVTFSIVNGPANGVAYFDTINRLVYRGAGNWSGVDTLTYKVNDGAADSNVATVTITVNPVNDMPSVSHDQYSVLHDRPLTVEAPGILADDSDVEGDPLTVELVQTTTKGTLTLNADGSFSYVPNAKFAGVDTFTYRANDGQLDSSIATVFISVTDQAPVLFGKFYGTFEDVVVESFIAATDADGDTLAYELIGGPAVGDLDFRSDGTFTYTPPPNYNGQDVFTVRATDGIFHSFDRSVTIEFAPLNDAPQPAADVHQVRQDAALVISDPAAGVLANDSDVDGDVLTASLNTPAAHGDVTVNLNGTFTYLPDPGFFGTDSFSYFADDGARTSVATVTLNVAPFGAPSSLTASVAGSDVTLNWLDNGSGYTDGFVIERAAKPKGKNSTPSFQQVAVTSSPAFTDSGVTSGTWLYRVKAFDGGYFSAYSTTLQVSVGGTSGGGGGGKPGKRNSSLPTESSGDAILTTAMQDEWSTQQTTTGGTLDADPTLDLLSLVQSGMTIEVKGKKN